MSEVDAKKPKGGDKKAAAGGKGDAKGKAEAAPAAGAGAGAGKKVVKKTGLAVSVRKDEDFTEWYTQTIVLSEMIEYYDVSGCYILRPWAFKYVLSATKWLSWCPKGVKRPWCCLPCPYFRF